MKEFENCCIEAFLFWLGINVVMCALGLLCAYSDMLRHGTSCEGPRARISYVMPGYRVGCWLGSVP